MLYLIIGFIILNIFAISTLYIVENFNFKSAFISCLIFDSFIIGLTLFLYGLKLIIQ